MNDIDDLAQKLKQDHDAGLALITRTHQYELGKVEEEAAHIQYFIECVKVQFGSRNDSLNDWTAVARSAAHEIAFQRGLAGSIWETELFNKFVSVARDGLEAFHAARRKLGLPESL